MAIRSVFDLVDNLVASRKETTAALMAASIAAHLVLRSLPYSVDYLAVAWEWPMAAPMAAKKVAHLVMSLVD